jgi:hemolysin activation/secretion protein
MPARDPRAQHESSRNFPSTTEGLEQESATGKEVKMHNSAIGPRIAVIAGLMFAGSAPASAQSTLDLRATSLGGVSVYEPAELLTFAGLVAAQRIANPDLADVADAIEAIYREDGYFLAEATVAPDGSTIIVREGEIGEIAVEGVDARTYPLVRDYLEPLLGRRAVTLSEFERRMMLIEDIDSITAVAEIDYPPGSDAARVRLVAEPLDANFGYVTLDNPSRQFGEAARLSFGQRLHSAFTPGDLLSLELSGAAEFDGDEDEVWGAAAYRFPLGASGAYVEAYLGSVTASRDPIGALSGTDFQGNTAILALGYPVIRNIDTFGYALFEVRRSSNDEDVIGTATGDFDSTVDVIAASWIHGRALANGGAWEYAVNVAAGQQDARSGGAVQGDDTFTHVRFGAGYERPVSWFGGQSSVRAEFWGQHSPDRLPAVEQFYIGGNYDERGYLFAEAQGDSGVSATFEIGTDLFPAEGGVRHLRPIGFLDIGYVKNNDPQPGQTEDATFASLGVGTDVDFGNGFFVRTYVAAPLTDGVTTKAGDPAFYLGLTRSW